MEFVRVLFFSLFCSFVYGISLGVLKGDEMLSFVVSMVLISTLMILNWIVWKCKKKRIDEIVEFLNDLSPELQRQAIERKPKWIRYLKDQTCELCMVAVKNDLGALSFVRYSKIEEEVIEKLDLKNNLDFVLMMQDTPAYISMELRAHK